MKYISAFFIAFVLLTMQSCLEKSGQAQNKNNDQPVQVLDVAGFEKKLAETADKTILDVRTQPEYEQGHLKNSVLMDVKQDGFKTKVNTLDKSKPVFVYCAAGIRSKKAATILKEQGFKEVYHMDGGIEEWEKENKPVTKN